MNVGLPLVSRARSGLLLLNRTLGLCMALLTSTYFFGSVMISALADPLVAALYGPKWAAAAPILALLAAAGFIRGFLSLMGVILIASDATIYQFWLHLVWIAVLTPGVVLGVHLWGTRGAATAQLMVGVFVVAPVALLLARRASGMAARPLVRSALYPMACSTVAAVGAHVLSGLVANPWGSVLLGGLAGCGVYAVLIHRWSRRAYADARALVADSSDPAVAV